MSGAVSHGTSASSSSEDDTAVGAGISVLLADDDPALREVLTLHLESQGYEVHVAADGEEALSLAQEIIPSVAILDIVMPLANGWEVARSLRKDPETAGIRLLMLSGIGADILGPNLAVLGGDVGLDKPFELDELDTALGLVLGR